MKATHAEFSFCDEPELDETDLEYQASIRPQFKDAYEFGRACRSLAVPVKSSEVVATI